jgi:hypothetical protein
MMMERFLVVSGRVLSILLAPVAAGLLELAILTNIILPTVLNPGMYAAIVTDEATQQAAVERITPVVLDAIAESVPAEVREGVQMVLGAARAIQDGTLLQDFVDRVLNRELARQLVANLAASRFDLNAPAVAQNLAALADNIIVQSEPFSRELVAALPLCTEGQLAALVSAAESRLADQAVEVLCQPPEEDIPLVQDYVRRVLVGFARALRGDVRERLALLQIEIDTPLGLLTITPQTISLGGDSFRFQVDIPRGRADGAATALPDGVTAYAYAQDSVPAPAVEFPPPNPDVVRVVLELLLLFIVPFVMIAVFVVYALRNLRHLAVWWVALLLLGAATTLISGTRIDALGQELALLVQGTATSDVLAETGAVVVDLFVAPVLAQVSTPVLITALTQFLLAIGLAALVGLWPHQDEARATAPAGPAPVPPTMPQHAPAPATSAAEATIADIGDAMATPADAIEGSAGDIIHRDDAETTGPPS